METYLNKIDYLIGIGKGSRRELADFLGITVQGVGRIVKTNSTKASTLSKIAEYFKVTPTYFYEKELTYEAAQTKNQINPIEVEFEIQHLKNEVAELKSMLLKLHSKII